MHLNTKNFLLILAVIITTSFASVFIYASFINPVEKIYVEESIRAQKIAERELLFSERINTIFKSSSPTNFISAAEKGTESVVFIRALERINDQSFYSDSYTTSTGSGVIISSDGYIVTNNHVVEKASQVEIMLNNNKEYNARIIGTDANTDLALLKVEADGLPFLTFGNSDSLRVGEWVMAIGNPFRLQSTVTAGIVSAKARNINILEDRGIESFIQTDAAVNPGNSGGALVNTKGDLVGINAAILSETGKYEGFSFAIPANLAKKVIADLRQFGAVQRGWMGVELQSVNDERAKEQKLSEVMGVYVALVNKNGAADEAGIKSGDIITSLNGNKIKSLPVFMEKIGQLRPGDKIRLEYYRNAVKKRVTVVLRNQLNTTDFIAVRKDKILTDIGFELRNLDSYEKSKYQTEGVMVVSVYRNSIISKSRLEPGFVITKINNNNVSDVNTIVDFLDQRKGTIVLEGFYENYPGEFPYTFELQ